MPPIPEENVNPRAPDAGSDQMPPAQTEGSTVGLAPVSDLERRLGQTVFKLTLPGFVPRSFDEIFYRHVDAAYSGFLKLPYGRAEKERIAARVAAAIRTDAAIAAGVVMVGYSGVTVIFFAILVAALDGVMESRGLLSMLSFPNVTMLIGVMLFSSLVLGWSIVSRVPKAFGRLILAYGVVLIPMLALFGLSKIAAAANGVVSGLAVGFVILVSGSFLVMSSIASVQSRMMSQFPEEAIITRILAILVRLSASSSDWRPARERKKIAAVLSEIAFFFEQGYARRFLGTDSTTNDRLIGAAHSCAAVFLAQIVELAFPDRSTRNKLRAFLWDALVKGASNRWGRIAVATESRASGSLGATILSVLSALAAVVVPAVGGFVALATVPDEKLRWNLAIAGFGLAAASLLSLLNPSRFDAQVSAAKALAELVNK